MRRARPVLATAAVLLLAACGSAAGSREPNWKPAPSVSNEPHLPQIEPALPTPAGPPGSGSTSPQSSPADPNSPSQQPTPNPSGSSNQDPNVVAKNLAAPRGIAVLPDATALVGERASGRIVRVQPQPNQPVTTVRTLTGLDTAGGGGLLDLTLSPTYTEDNLVYAYITTKTDARIVTFTLKGPVTTVVAGLPKIDGRILFDSKDLLYIESKGKVLRVSDIGRPAPDNPTPSSPTWAPSASDPAGLCTNVPAAGGTGTPPPDGPAPMLQVRPGTSGPGEVSLVAPDEQPPAELSTLPAGTTDPGDCAIYDNALYVTSLDGQNLLRATITGTGDKLAVGKWNTVLKPKQYGRLLTVTAGPDGSLWLATSNKDGHGKPVADDERIIRIMASGGGQEGSKA